MSWAGKAWANDTNIPVAWCRALRNAKAFLNARGDVCEEFPDGQAVAVGDRDASSVVNARLTLALDNQNHMIGTFWISTRRQSSGVFLYREYLNELYGATVILTLLAIGWVLLVYLAIRRLISVFPVHLKQYYPPRMSDRNVFLLLLARAAARDDDYYLGYIDERVRRYGDRYARRLGGDSAFFWRTLDLLIDLLTRRVSQGIRQFWRTITRGTKTVWRRALKLA